MGGDLAQAPNDTAVSLLIHAVKDPVGANLDRVQVIKGWLDEDGETHERVYDVAWAGRRAPGANGKVPAIGSTVDVARATYDPPSVMADETRYGNIAGAYTFTAQAAEVEVDVETGRIEVLRLIAADDIGRALNPLTAEGQVEGAVIQGLGLALFERMIYEAGEVVNGSLADYPLPKAEGSPRVQTILVETNDPYGPFGAKGVGEAPIIPTAAAVANAVYDAVGVRITELPITPEKLLKAIRAQNGP